MSEKSTKSVPSGTLASGLGPVHEHGLRATAARSAHQARESTHPTLPTKRKPKKLGGERKMGVDKPVLTDAENFALIPPPLEGSEKQFEHGKKSLDETVKLSAHENIHTSSELSSDSRLAKVRNSSAAHSGGSGGASRAAQEVAHSKQVSTQLVSLDKSINSLQAALTIPVQILSAPIPGEGRVVLGIGTGVAQAQLAATDAPSASTPLEQEESSVETHLPKQSNTGGTAKRRPTRVPAMRTIDAPSASNPLGQEESSVDTHLQSSPIQVGLRS